MTEQEFIQQYGDWELGFRGYYKYIFTFANEDLEVSVGGDKDDIYRCSIKPTMTVRGLSDQAGTILRAELNGEVIFND